MALTEHDSPSRCTTTPPARVHDENASTQLMSNGGESGSPCARLGDVDAEAICLCESIDAVQPIYEAKEAARAGQAVLREREQLFAQRRRR